MKIDFRHHTTLYLGLHEIELAKHFYELVQPAFKSFDIGGSGGYYALLMAKLSQGGKVVSFECDGKAAEEMRATFAQNPFVIYTLEAYVGKEHRPGFITIDAAAKGYFVPDFIKIDIEGAEDEALEGAHQTLSNRKPGLIIEVHSEEKERRCFELLGKYAYRPIVVDQRSWLKELRPLAHNRWLICPGK